MHVAPESTNSTGCVNIDDLIAVRQGLLMGLQNNPVIDFDIPREVGSEGCASML